MFKEKNCLLLNIGCKSKHTLMFQQQCALPLLWSLWIQTWFVSAPEPTVNILPGEWAVCFKLQASITGMILNNPLGFWNVFYSLCLLKLLNLDTLILYYVVMGDQLLLSHNTVSLYQSSLCLLLVFLYKKPVSQYFS